MPVFISIFRRGHQRLWHRIHQLVIREPVARFDRPIRRPLRLLVTQSLHGKLYVGRSQQRIDDSRVEPQRVIRGIARHCPKAAHIADIQLLRLPGFEAFFDLPRKPLRIGRRAERLFRQDRRCLMMPMAIAIRARKPRHQHVRTKGSNHPHHVAERDIVPLPLLKCFFGSLRISKIRHARESLLNAVISVGSQQLQRPQHAQRVEQIAAQLVLSPFPARQRHQQCRDAFPARFERQHAAVFVIGMRRDLHQTGRRLQASQHQLQPRRTGFLRERFIIMIDAMTGRGLFRRLRWGE